mgnify:CR=1 FL=1
MPSVVLPEPDSPTMPSVSPRRSGQRRVAAPHRSGGCGTSRAGSSKLTRTSLGLDQHAARRRRSAAPARRGRLASSALRVGVLRRGEHLLGRPGLDQAAALHHADPVREAAHQVEVVGDEEQRHAHLGLQRVEQGQDLRLDGHVEGGGRLVGDQRAWAGRRAPSRSSPAAAGRPRAGAARRRPAAPARGCRCLREQLDRPRARRAAAAGSSAGSSTSPICAPTVCSGFSAVIGSWKIIAISPPRTAAHLALGRPQQVAAGEADRAAASRRRRPGRAPTAR